LQQGRRGDQSRPGPSARPGPPPRPGPTCARCGPALAYAAFLAASVTCGYD